MPEPSAAAATALPDPAPGGSETAPARRRPRLAVRLLGLATALVFGLVVGEGLVRIVAPQPLSGSWREIGPGGYPVNRAGGTAKHTFERRVVEYRFNDARLRGGPIDPERFNVLCLGDSFTFGWLVDEPATYVMQMQAHADADPAVGAGRVQFLNAGVGGWSTAACLAFLEDAGDAIRPDAVVCFLNCWDIGRSMSSGIWEFDDAERTTLRRGVPPVQVSGAQRALTKVPGYRWLLERSHLLQLVRNTVVKVQTKDPTIPGEAAPRDAGGAPAAAPRRSLPLGKDAARERWARDLGTAMFRRMAAWCAERKVPLWVVTTGRPDVLPSDGLGTPSGHLEATMAFKQVAPAFFRESGIFFADITPAVVRDCGGDFGRVEIRDGGHPDEEGCRIIGLRAWEAIAPELRRALPAR